MVAIMGCNSVADLFQFFTKLSEDGTTLTPLSQGSLLIKTELTDVVMQQHFHAKYTSMAMLFKIIPNVLNAIKATHIKSIITCIFTTFMLLCLFQSNSFSPVSRHQLQ